MEKIRDFLTDESGATAAEYGLIIALIAGAILLALSVFGTNLATLFNSMVGKFTIKST
jgi:pilus assembly protein Flp/PilA